MKNLTKCRLAFVVAAAMGIAGCGSDGKDGEDGAPGEPGPGPTPPVTEMSEVTHITMISHAIEEGQIRYEFEVTNEEDELVEGLVKAEAKFAEKTERGVVLNRDGAIGGYTDTTKEGTVLTGLGEGRYELVAAMPAVTAASEGIVWLRVGGDDSTQIARSQPLVVDKPEMIHTTTSETCNSCHVDYGDSSLKHPSYAAINTDGEADLVAGCMVCHNNVSRAEEEGGYATNTLQKIGHINHQKFEKDFTPTNCYTCHAEPVINTSIAGNGCNDCHTSDSAAAAIVQANSDFDARAFHAQSALIGLEERQTIRAEHSTTLSAIYQNAAGDYCTDLSLYKGEEMLNIEALYADGTLSYASTYIHGYHNESIVGRESRSYSEIYNADGSKTMCHATLDLQTAQIMASSRLTFKGGNWIDDDSKYGVSFTSYSPVTELADLSQETEYDRRHAVTTDSCTTCHNNETNYHKNGSYVEGGLDCVACHNNGQDRSAKNSAPGFGPMVHSMHWGIGNELSGAKTDEDGNNVPNSADSLNADNCVSCHAEGISLAEIPNQYMLSKAYNGGVSGVMTSPVTANCYACHDSASALSHMEQNGGELNVPAGDDWYTHGTAESCATCHDTGKSFGIDKFHNFER
ncbi:cytochrome c3 family protein [uncultured Shewanella sp.]|uniref:multiheme c-type cytochrome n=1 Tax=uncultured Shewanella sp. TaxID=173975 RepID=UPI002605ED4D|nr:cytochrome c3 family protein [uncultured Shewanella sp.]